MSDKQDTTDYIGIPRVNMSSASVDESHSVKNESPDLIEQDTILYEKHFKNEVVKEQGDDISRNVSKEESEFVLERETVTDEDLKNEIEAFLLKEKTMNDTQKTNELGIPIENENISDESSLKSSNATSQRLEETTCRSEESAGLSMKDNTSCIMEDSSSGSSDKEDQALEDTQLYYTYEPDLNGAKFETNDEQMPISLEHISKEDDTFSQNMQIPDGTVEERNMNYGNDSNISAIENAGIRSEDSPEHGTVSQTTQVPDCTGADEQNSNSGNISDVYELDNAGIRSEDSPEDGAVEQTTQVPDGTDEQNSNSGNISDVSELENAGTSFEGFSEDSFEGISESTQVSEETVDEKNLSSETNSNEIENAERSTEDSDEEISNDKESPPKEGRRTSEQVTETISRCLNSEEYIKKLNEIDEIVKHLTAIEFISPHLSTEDVEALEELNGQVAHLVEDVDRETYSEVSESNATKRKSKESSELEDELQATSKKYKFSKDLDSWPLSGENLCCLEEQFRLASELSKEDNEGQSHRDKEYKFPVTTGGGEQKRRSKLCKHQIEKIGEMVVSAMSMENYLSQLNDEIDNSEMSTDDFISNGSSNRNQTLPDSQSNVSKSGSSSARTRTFSKKNVAQQSFHKEEISQPKEQFSGVEMNPKGYGCFGFGEAFNSIKNLILVVSFTGSLTIAITIAKLFGVTFPIPKSQRNDVRDDSKCSLQEFPDVNLDEV